MRGRWSSLWGGCRQPPHAAYPQLRRPGPGLAAYLALLRLGVTVPRLLPGARWALTPPFHPYPWITKGGLFSVALSVASRRPGVTWQSALWSSDFPRHATSTDVPRPSRPTATQHQSYGLRKGPGKASAPAAAAGGPSYRATRASPARVLRRGRAKSRRSPRTPGPSGWSSRGRPARPAAGPRRARG